MVGTHVHKINRDLIFGWMAIVLILFVSYVGEVLKNERTVSYVVVFMMVAAIPALICLIIYMRNPDDKRLRYEIVIGYSLFYIFSMLTGNTELVFTYILPMLSLLVLYHQPRLILVDGIVSMAVNIIYVLRLFFAGMLNSSNTKNIEIQLTLLFLCFAGSYMATRLFDSITKENELYVAELDEKNTQIQRMTLQSIMTIANTIDAKDEYTRGHSRRVAEYSVAIAREMGLSTEEAERIRFIALLHDIGKIGVPDSVLNKPGKLTDEEYTLMKQHTVIGADILKDITTIPGIDVGARYHHERYDGSGYPDGLKEEEIPFVARIIAAADAYDAMTSNRVYRRQLNHDKVMSELKNGLGTQFDPVVGQALINLVEKGLLPEQKLRGKVVAKISKENTEKIVNRFMSQETVENEEELFDPLTGVYTQSAGQERVRKEMKEHCGCLIIFNIDHFWETNQSVGFRMGDIMLKSVVEAIQKISGRKIVYRSRGDEFIVYFSDETDEIRISGLLERFMEEIHALRAKNTELSMLSVSAGAAINTDLAEEGSGDIYSRADKALYYVKQQGGDQYGFHHSSGTHRDKPNLSKVDLEDLIRHIKNRESYSGGFQVAYPEFARIYELIQKVSERNNKEIQILMFTILLVHEKAVSLEEREYVMNILEKAIIGNIRGQDVTTKYSSTQRIVLLFDLSEEQIEIVTSRILKDFYRMYDKKQVSIHYDIADLK